MKQQFSSQVFLYKKNSQIIFWYSREGLLTSKWGLLKEDQLLNNDQFTISKFSSICHLYAKSSNCIFGFYISQKLKEVVCCLLYIQSLVPSTTWFICDYAAKVIFKFKLFFDLYLTKWLERPGSVPGMSGSESAITREETDHAAATYQVFKVRHIVI